MDDTKTLSVHTVARRVSFGDGHGGLERSVGDQVKWLAEDGRVRIVLHAAMVSGIVPQGVEIRLYRWCWWNRSMRGPLLGLAYLAWNRALADALVLFDPSDAILHFHGAAVGVRSRMQRAARSVVNPHGLEEFGPRSWLREPARFLLRREIRRGCVRTDAVVATDHALLAEVARLVKVSRRQLVVIPNAIDVAKLASQVSWPTIKRPGLIVSVGRVAYNKGYDMLPQVLKDASVASGKQLRWEHYGSGRFQQSVADQLRNWNVQFTHHHGATDAQVWQAMAEAEVVVQPSRYEGSSLVVLEAMALGAVVVATAVGGIPDKIKNEQTGFLASEPTEAEIALALVRALLSPNCAEISSNARELVQNVFDRAAAVESYVTLYGAVAVVGP